MPSVNSPGGRTARTRLPYWILVIAAGCIATLAVASTDHTVTIQGNLGPNSFDPPKLQIEPGDRVRWHNADVMAHTATADDSSWDTGTILPAQASGFITFDQPGTFPYHCAIPGHNMTGVIEVVEPAEILFADRFELEQ